jgi:hypothetical protein
MNVNYTAEARVLAVQLFGRFVSDDELAAAVGVLDGAALHVRVKGDQLLVTINHPWIVKQERSFRRDRQGVLCIYNVHFEKRRDAPAGVGLESFRRQVAGARHLGVQRIELWAAGYAKDKDYNGYYTWARFGFDAPLNEKERRELYDWPGLSGALTLNDVVERGGLKWWRRSGTERTMCFELHRESRMSRIFRAYLLSKGIVEES